MRISVYVYRSNKTIILNVEPTDKIIAIKNIVYQFEGLKPHEQSITHIFGNSLKDHQTLSELNINV